MLKYLVVSTICFERAIDPVRKLSTDPAPLACNKYNISIIHKLLKAVKRKKKYTLACIVLLHARTAYFADTKRAPENNAVIAQDDQEVQHS